MLDKETIEKIAEECYSYVYSFCYTYTIGNKVAAEDITQDVFLLLQEKAENLNDGNIKAWLISVARLKIKEHFRDVQERYKILTYEDGMGIDADIFAVVDDYFRDSDEKIEKCKAVILKSLTKSEMELYRKIYIEKKKHAVVAAEMNITENAVGVRAVRLRKKIHKLINFMFSAFGQIIIKMFF